MTPKCLYSSASDLYSSPPDLFRELDRRFGPLTLDVCALPENAKCPNFYTPEQDGLKQPWTGRCWCNPPYGRKIRKWLLKAVKSALTGATVVCLLPARVDTRWWHELVEPYAAVIEFVKGRLLFGGSKNKAPFASVVVVFEPISEQECRWCGRMFMPSRKDAIFCRAACKQAAYRQGVCYRCTRNESAVTNWDNTG
jgi:phage N-6-adenine-methyltransferase